MMRSIFHRLQLVFAQGKTTLVGKDTVQAKVLDGETLDNLDRVEPYGLSYHPKPGSRAYLQFPSGDRSYGVALIIGDKRYQLDLQEGEVALHDDAGNYVMLKQGGIVETKASSKVIATTPLFETSGDAKVGGNLLVVGNMTAAAAIAGSFAGAAGTAASMPSGITAAGAVALNGGVTANGKNIGAAHTHTTGAPGYPTSGVI
ncbi:MAG: phage baseplate assembly protein [Gallionella sp.]